MYNEYINFFFRRYIHTEPIYTISFFGTKNLFSVLKFMYYHKPPRVDTKRRKHTGFLVVNIFWGIH